MKEKRDKLIEEYNETVTQIQLLTEKRLWLMGRIDQLNELLQDSETNE